MRRVSAYSLRVVCLCPLLLLLLAGSVRAQTETPTAEGIPTDALTATATVTVTVTETPSPTPTTTATPSLSPTASPTTGASPSPSPTLTPTPALSPVVPLPQTTPTPTPPPGGLGGLLGGDGLAPLLLGGLLLLAGVAVISLLLLRRRLASPAPARVPVAAPLPPAEERVTSVLVPVYLELESDPSQRFAIHETPFAIGRDDGNALVIDESFPQWQTVSREHAVISHHPRGYLIEDLGSQNGVRVNGRLTPKNLLRNGWQVAIGGVTFRFVDEMEPE